MDFWIPLLGGALGAALINGVFAFFKLRHDKLTEHGQWLRDQQLTAYADLVDSTQAAMQWVSSAHKIESRQARNDAGLAMMASTKAGQLVMLAPTATLNAANDMINSLHDIAGQVSTHGYPPGSPEFDVLFANFANKQRMFNGRCRTDFLAPK